MPLPVRSPIVVSLALVGFTGFAAPACGASINAVYEGDVRFEHCMALDDRPDVKPTLRLACWNEWVEYYTFGQTRDRVEYAHLRQRVLQGDSNFVTSDLPPIPEPQKAVPEPTTVLAPPPMFGTAPSATADAGAPPPPPPPEPPAVQCATQCKASWTTCQAACTKPACEKTCNAAYNRCMRTCHK